MKNKRGQLGMGVAKGFILGLMALVIIGVTTLIVLSSLADTSFATDTINVANEIGYVNQTTYTISVTGVKGFTNPQMVSVFNATDNGGGSYNLTIPSTNYTLSSLGVLSNATLITYPNVSMSYTYDASNNIVSVTDNSSDGIADFFSNVSTWLALLGVVIIILIISVVISVVNKFGTGSRI